MTDLFFYSSIILWIIGVWKIFKKAGIARWKALVPIYNIFNIIRISGRSGSFFMVYIISFFIAFRISLQPIDLLIYYLFLYSPFRVYSLFYDGVSILEIINLLKGWYESKITISAIVVFFTLRSFVIYGLVKKFDRGGIWTFLTTLFPSIGFFILGISNLQYKDEKFSSEEILKEEVKNSTPTLTIPERTTVFFDKIFSSSFVLTSIVTLLTPVITFSCWEGCRSIFYYSGVSLLRGGFGILLGAFIGFFLKFIYFYIIFSIIKKSPYENKKILYTLSFIIYLAVCVCFILLFQPIFAPSII